MALAVAAASHAPGRWAAVVPLGGATSLRDTEGLAAVPFLIGIGDRDAALPAARELKRALERISAKDVLYREYAAVEHLLVVPVALPDVFAFFDERISRTPPAGR